MSVTTPAKELTPKEADDLRDHCHDLLDTIKEGLIVQRKSLWDVAKTLVEFDDLNGYRVLGYSTLGEWLADPEIGMTKSTYYRLTSVYREMSIRQIPIEQVKELDTSKVDIVLPAVNAGKVTIQEALGDAETLPQSDLREKYLGRKPKPAKDDPENEAAKPAKTHTYDEFPASAAEVSTNGAAPIEYQHPSQAQFDEMVKRAKKRRRNFAQYAQWVGKWTLLDAPINQTADDPEWGSKPGHWDVRDLSAEQDVRSDDRKAIDAAKEEMGSAAEARAAWLALRNELEQAVESGQANPRVSASLIAAGLMGLDEYLGEGSPR